MSSEQEGLPISLLEAQICNSLPRFSGEPILLDRKKKIVLSVGRLSPEKGFDVLLAAWQLLGYARDGWLLRLVGSGPEENALKLLVQELSIDGSVFVVGQSRDLEREYRAASIYVMSSRRKGFGMVLLEAQHFGLACISTDCETGPRKLLAPNSGILVPVDDAQSLADNLARLMSEPELRVSMGHAAFANAENYRPIKIRRQWQQLFEQLLVET
jgi:glycosyltransferase involved in cell wall biosynthesis